MSQPKVSIIIPVYNAEAYIERCATSLFEQTLDELEYIFIDDCTPDRSIEVMENTLARYPERREQVNIIRHAQNQGVSQSRQDGLDAATGEYVIHCDPDDWVELDMYESLYREAQRKNADMVICDFFENTQRKERYISQNITSTSSEDILNALLSQQLHGACWNKLIRRVCFDEYNISFPNDIIRWEDLYVICSLTLNDLNIVYEPKAYYHYDLYSNEASIVRKPSQLGVESQIRFCKHFENTPPRLLNNLYYCKIATKILMIQSELYSPEDAVTLFEEVNKAFISDNKCKRLSPAAKLLYNCILGKNEWMSKARYKLDKSINYSKAVIKLLLRI